jgi:hypothetical protein
VTRSLRAFVLLIAIAAPARAQVATHVTIQGPPPPVAPDVVSRDAERRVTLRAFRVESLDVDGRLDDEIYSRVAGVSDFVQQEPDEGAPATERTEVWVLFDRRHVYVSARCWDSQPDRIVANEMRRDHGNIFQNDNFSIVFDTFYDRRNGFLFQTNPLGGLRDGLVTDERNNNRDWNTVWDVKTARFEQGWTLEMAIPFKSLRYRATGEQIWGFNVARIVRSKNEWSYLTPIPASYGVVGLFKFSSAATVVGIETPAQARNLEVKPYAISSLSTNHDAAPPFSDDLDGDAGFDVKYGLTRGLIFDFTYNTDFAQVEDDEQQVNLTRFSLFFPEKRDFFLEGQGIFAFGGPQRGQGGSGGAGGNVESPIIFFSRQIGLNRGLAVPILAGGRLTGRAGKFGIGLLNIQTNDSATAGAEATNFSVVRLKRDILRRSDVGFIATRRDPAGQGGTNEVAGVDLNLNFFQDLQINGYYARSRTPRLDGDEASYRAGLIYAGDRYGLQAEHLLVGENFNPEIGFMRRQDFRRNFVQARFSPRPRGIKAVRKFAWEGSWDHFENRRGRLETREVVGTFRVELSSGDQWSADYTRSYELLEAPFRIASGVSIPVGGYSFHEARTTYRLGPQRKLSGSFTVARGTFFSGERTEGIYSGRVEISPRFSVEPRLSVSHVELPQGDFTATLVGMRGSFTLSPRLAAGALVQYNSSNDTVGTNLRFRWEYGPGSDLFIVYTEGRDTSLRGFPELDNRSVVIKLTRLFRF